MVLGIVEPAFQFSHNRVSFSNAKPLHRWFSHGFSVGNTFPCVFVFTKQLNPRRATKPLVKTCSSFPGFLTVVEIRSDSCGRPFPVFARVSILVATKVTRAKYSQEFTQQQFISDGVEVFDPDEDNKNNFTEGFPSRTETNTVVFSNGARAYGINESYAMDMRFSNVGEHRTPKWRRSVVVNGTDVSLSNVVQLKEVLAATEKLHSGPYNMQSVSLSSEHVVVSRSPDWAIQRRRLPSNPNNLGILQYSPRRITDEAELKYVLKWLSKKVFGGGLGYMIDYKEAFYFNVKHRGLFPRCYPPKIPSSKDISKKPERGNITRLMVYMVRLELCYIFKKFNMYPGLGVHVEVNDDIVCMLLVMLNVMDPNRSALPDSVYGVTTKGEQPGTVGAKRKRETKMVF